MTHLENNSILNDAHYGFRKKISCETQLFNTVNHLAKSLDDNSQVDTTLLDFSKAFDKVPHQRLLYKLQFYGVCSSIHKWIAHFLYERSQRVVLDGCSQTSCLWTQESPKKASWDTCSSLPTSKTFPNTLPTDQMEIYLLMTAFHIEASPIQMKEDAATRSRKSLNMGKTLAYGVSPKKVPGFEHHKQEETRLILEYHTRSCQRNNSMYTSKAN